DYSDNVDADWFPDAAADLLLNHYKKHIPNGITYVGGAGSDRITGTDYDDILYGHDKEGKDDDEATDTLVGGKGSDKLYGGKGDDILVGHTGSMIDDNIRDELYGGDGFDTYYVGDKDVIFDSDGKGKVVLENKELTGGIYDENQNAYLSPDKTLKYYLSGNETTLIVKDIVSGKTVIIDNYSKDKKSLGIELSQAPLEEIAILSDTTGSMGLAIDSVKTQAMDIVNLAFSRDANARIGVFGYNDPGVQTFTHLTNDKNAVLSAINSLYASGGGDWPEMTWHGVYNAAMSNWSEKSVKRLFVFGDAPAKDEEFKQAALDALSGKNISMISGSAPGGSTSTAGVGRGAIEVYAIQTGGGKEVSSDFKELAQKSGGKFINLEEYNARDYSVADAIYDSINSGTAKDDVLKGNEKNNRIEAGAGNDKIYGGKGDDVITGGAGDDTIYGEEGA
ncbi:MAG: VWA domain-containing protein, partial [Campylobacter sp.]|nr:VWA domain-containing protein [Campylobacter sp.]